jgi:hypothetical protein
VRDDIEFDPRQKSEPEIAADSGSSAARFMSIPTRRDRSACCARTVGGHAEEIAIP